MCVVRCVRRIAGLVTPKTDSSVSRAGPIHGAMMNESPVLGENVVIVRTLMDGRVTREVLPAALAVYEALYGKQNGLTVKSARVEFGRVVDRWGQSG